ncbi:hypothetical protein Agub_g10491 [Astrephomene gubernaculifera]|uniref:Uncharacterized protein n=1 Tax=Astrephomene gubernaculifera TaxID=47775 RepID=A0AAD3HPR8_9CHLO|nr:hypothetical protein Agub_g10491 [Astrephomene gubernaculifera]
MQAFAQACNTRFTQGCPLRSATPDLGMPSLALSNCRSRLWRTRANANLSASVLETKPSERRRKTAWIQRRARKQQKQLKGLEWAEERLLDKMLDLDDEGCNARLCSNALASSSTSGDLNSSRSHQRLSRLVPPSPEVLMAMLRGVNAKRALLEELDVRNPASVARRLLRLSSLLALPPAQLLLMARRCPRLLVTHRPEQLQAALQALEQCLQQQLTATSASGASAATRGMVGSSGGSGQRQQEPGIGTRGGGGMPRSGSGSVAIGAAAAAAGATAAWDAGEELQAEAASLARRMLAAAPELLLMAPERLVRSGLELGAVCKARGMQLLPLLRLRPDLLSQSPARLAAKMDLLPRLLGLPHARVRHLIQTAPDLLRRSPAQVSRRYQLLASLLGPLPPAFVAELAAQEPRVLALGAASLAGKFRSLYNRGTSRGTSRGSSRGRGSRHLLRHQLLLLLLG